MSHDGASLAKMGCTPKVAPSCPLRFVMIKGQTTATFRHASVALDARFGSEEQGVVLLFEGTMVHDHPAVVDAPCLKALFGPDSGLQGQVGYPSLAHCSARNHLGGVVQDRDQVGSAHPVGVHQLSEVGVDITSRANRLQAGCQVGPLVHAV